MTASVRTARPAPRPFGFSDADRFVVSALERAAADRVLAVIRLPAPLAPIDAPLRALRKGHSFVWHCPDGTAYSGHGTSAVIRASGNNRFEDVRRQRVELFQGHRRFTHPDVIDAPPRLYGGWAFAEGSADREPWLGFGDACFFLPRWTYEGGSLPPTLMLAIDMRDGWTPRIALVRSELRAVFAALTTPPRDPIAANVIATQTGSKAQWRARIDAILSAISKGEAHKVVAARRTVLSTDRDLDPWSVLRALSVDYGDTWRFGIRLGMGTFTAATPERLFEKRQAEIETDALAGSIGADVPNAARTLRHSFKDQREHRPVVQHLAARLGTFASQIAPAGAPVVRRLPNVLHLHTPIRGRLSSADIAPEAIVQALHPTPAVGGAPTNTATDWIDEHEPHKRGWYCGPVGWIDANGDAQLTVALRCGMIRGPSAWAWAGGGIVEGSCPDAEWRETELKLQPILQAVRRQSCQHPRAC